MKKVCPCCGTPYRVALGWLNKLQETETEQLIQLWGEATIMRALMPEGPPLQFGDDGWDDPVWHRNWDQLKAGRMDYPDDTPGHRRQGSEGKEHLLDLLNRLMEQIAEESGLTKML